MFSDTHFHYEQITRGRGVSGEAILKDLVARDTFFAQDIGTHCDDLASRIEALEEDISALRAEDGEKARSMLYLSAGIWPAPEAIVERNAQVAALESEIARFQKGDGLGKKIVSLGECGLDRHWNKDGADGRDSADFTPEMLEGERELFQMQLLLAKKLSLPVIVHSRDAAEETLDCIKNIGYDFGIIHCFSYGINEARAFLDRGWYISFSGSVTYTKKSRLEEMRSLLNFVPLDRILLETDAPYLAPSSLRGSVNTPVNVALTYQYVADMRLMCAQDLSQIVDRNIKALYRL